MSESTADSSAHPQLLSSLRWREVLSNLLLTATTGLLAWGLLQTVNHAERISLLEQTTIRGSDVQTVWSKVAEHAQRLSALESGSSTPMAPATRATFDAHDQRLDMIEAELRQFRLSR